MTSLVLHTSKDTYISGGKPDKNYARSSLLYVGTDRQYSVQRALLWVDLFPVPADIVLESAYLRMYAEYAGDRRIPAHITPWMVASDWTETQVTWNSQPAVNPSLAGQSVEVDASGWNKWDITNILQAWLQEKSCNCGLLLKTAENGSADVRSFYSSRSYYYRSFTPCLEIRYSSKSCPAPRDTENSLEECMSQDTLCFSQWQNTSIYTTYTFFVQNTGQNPAQLSIQVSPDKAAVFNEAAIYNIAPGETGALVPQRFGFFTRLAMKSFFCGKSTSLKIWFQAQA